MLDSLGLDCGQQVFKLSGRGPELYEVFFNIWVVADLGNWVPERKAVT